MKWYSFPLGKKYDFFPTKGFAYFPVLAKNHLFPSFFQFPSLENWGKQKNLHPRFLLKNHFRLTTFDGFRWSMKGGEILVVDTAPSVSHLNQTKRNYLNPPKVYIFFLQWQATILSSSTVRTYRVFIKYRVFSKNFQYFAISPSHDRTAIGYIENGQPIRMTVH